MQADASQGSDGPAARTSGPLGRAQAATCQVHEVLDRVGDKWTLAVIHQLDTGSHRFTELKRAIPGVSQRMLTATLRTLERDGLVLRTVHPVVPPRVDYELTALGHTLLESAWTVMGWAQRHAEDIDSARERYDARQRG